MNQELLYKYFRGTATIEEEKRILDWVEASEENREAFLKERMIFDVALFSDRQSSKKKTFRLAPILKWGMRIAAVIIIANTAAGKAEEAAGTAGTAGTKAEKAAEAANTAAGDANSAAATANNAATAANQSKTNADAAATRANAAAENVEGLEVTDLVNRIKGMEEQMEQVGLLMYPIGSIYESTVNTNPQEYFGGTWEAFGAGRTTVGVDAGQTEFDQVKKTGGSKTQTLTQAQLPKITGRVEAGSGNKGTESRGYGAFRTASGVFSVNSDDYQYSMPKRENATSWPSGYGKYSFEMSVGGDQPHNNMPPYITVYRWVRIA